MSGNIGTACYNGLRQVILKTCMLRPPISSASGRISAFQQMPQRRHVFTTPPSFLKEIVIIEENDKILVEGRPAPSPREKYLAKLTTNPSSCEECPLCKLGLQVRHTDVLIISQFINSKGKQLPRKVTGLCRDQHKRMNYLIIMAEKAGLIEREVERTIVHNKVILYTPEEWEDPHFHKYYDETVIEEFLYKPRKRHL